MSAAGIMERARRFIYGNARLLDRKRYEYHFEEGSAESVVEALRAYQNHDGGFGNALEPDIRCPHSQPVPTEMALAIMEEVDRFDERILEGVAAYGCAGSSASIGRAAAGRRRLADQLAAGQSGRGAGVARFAYGRKA
ncbi:MAG: terpenoid cyclase/protein prenyltransferase alpha-alpha toroid [Paenibacillus sp.]|jgi:hypothetical protein|nr:terpenoid cyclase/protein prenyltransferase alpha-alpha toroid [Paenibacillus sp.]